MLSFVVRSAGSHGQHRVPGGARLDRDPVRLLLRVCWLPTSQILRAGAIRPGTSHHAMRHHDDLHSRCSLDPQLQLRQTAQKSQSMICDYCCVVFGD